jgi:hypothetical protein
VPISGVPISGVSLLSDNSARRAACGGCATWKDFSTDSYSPSISSASERPVMVTVGVRPPTGPGVLFALPAEARRLCGVVAACFLPVDGDLPVKTGTGAAGTFSALALSTAASFSRAALGMLRVGVPQKPAGRGATACSGALRQACFALHAQSPLPDAPLLPSRKRPEQSGAGQHRGAHGHRRNDLVVRLQRGLALRCDLVLQGIVQLRQERVGKGSLF